MTLNQGQRPFKATMGQADTTFRRLEEQLPLTPHRFASRLITVATTASDSDDVFLADATGGAFTVTMPTAANFPGRRFTVVRMNGGANNVTIATVLGGNIALTTQYAFATVQSCLSTAPATFTWVRIG